MKTPGQMLFLHTGYSIWASPHRRRSCASVHVVKMRVHHELGLTCYLHSTQKGRLKTRLHGRNY